MPEITLDAATIEIIAQQIAAMLKQQGYTIVKAAQPVTDPWLSRDEAAEYLRMPLRTFTRLRKSHPEGLKPAFEEPLRWSRDTLDVFKMSRNSAPVKRGRPRKVAAPAA